MIAFPNAKINLGLHILFKRADGFHEISTCFYPIGWSDVLEVVPSQEEKMWCGGRIINTSLENNLCWKAYQLLKKAYQLPSVSIGLYKALPIGSGLGGGSSDGAFTLRLLNELFDLKITTEKLEEYALSLGSDCPFFIRNAPAFASGRGEILTPCDVSLKGKFIVVVFPDLPIATKDAFAEVKPKIPTHSLQDILKMPISSWKEHLTNDFEETLFRRYTILPTVKEKLYEIGAVYASMSGSGSAIYGIFDHEVTTTDLFPKHFSIWTGYL